MSLSNFEQKIVDFLRKHQDKSFTLDEIASAMEMSGMKQYKRIVKAMAFLERAGEVTLSGSYKFKAAFKAPETITGTFRANAKGFGFISYEEGEADLFVPPQQSGAAMHGDTVLAKVIKLADPKTGKGSEAQIIQVLERAASQLVGEFFAYNQDQRQETGYIGYVIPQGDYSDQVKILIESDGIRPVDGTIVIAKITQYPSQENPNLLIGKVAKEIGHKDAPGVDILSVLFQFGIPHEFPQNVIDEANAVSQTISPADLRGRRDLRDQLIITIDGADAKDLDDAISLSKNADGTYQLGVHIADVSYYVKEGSAMDREAYERGTSVYLTDRVVPMLPQRLSNGICSLHPNEDRLTLTCDMTIDQAGKVIAYDIYPSVIHSSYRMTYENVNKMLAGDAALLAEYQEISDLVQDMADLHHLLESKRKSRGALDFDAPEAKILVDANGHPTDIVMRTRHDAERLIESFMLAANETVAYDYTQKQVPFMYRVHEQPTEEKMLRFAEFVTTFGMVLRGNVATIKPKQLQQALAAVKGQPYEQVVSTMMLRSMQQAKYSDQPLGHYGLAAQDYTHFTSPIRRYPDLIVHRLIRQYLIGKPSGKDRDKLEEKLPQIADQASRMERRAVEAERETDAIKKAEYMLDKVGQSFDGVISSVTSFGMFVSLPNTVEGLIALRDLEGDYYKFNQAHLALVGERTGKVFRIGQKVTVEVAAVSVSDRTIDFKLLYAEPSDPIPSHKEKRGKGRHSAKENPGFKMVQNKQKDKKKKAQQSRKVFKRRKV